MVVVAHYTERPASWASDEVRLDRDHATIVRVNYSYDAARPDKVTVWPAFPRYVVTDETKESGQ
jgi:hypothetical protein